MKKKILSVLLIIALLFSVLNINSYNVNAASKSKKAYYVSILNGKKPNKIAVGNIYSIKISGNNLIIYGTLAKAKSRTSFLNHKYTKLSYKKRVYKIAPNCKFYLAGGSDPARKVKKKEFMRLAHCYNGLAFKMSTNSSGKVYEMCISS